MVPHSLSRTLAIVVVTAALGASLTPPRAHADQGGVQWGMTGSTQMYTLGNLLSHKFIDVIGASNLQIAVNPSSSQAAFYSTCTGGTMIGMSDVYIQDNQLTESDICRDMVGIPVAISATPVVYNLPGAYFNQRRADGFTLTHPVKLTSDVMAAIYSCTVTRWNDPAIARLNPGMALPPQHIEAYNLSEPGGAAFVFNQWLALSVPSWNKSVGVALQPAWPRCSIGQASTGAMANAIKTTPYSIGFAGFDFAISYGLQAAALKNASGYFVTPSLNGLSVAINSALRTIGMPKDFRRPFVTVKDAPGSSVHAFNPACFEFFLVHRDLKRSVGSSLPIRQSVKRFLQWSITDSGGQQFIEQIEFRKVAHGTKSELAHGFIPVPQELRNTIRDTVNSIQE